MRPCPAVLVIAANEDRSTRPTRPKKEIIACDLFKNHSGRHLNLDHGDWANRTEAARAGHYDHLFDYPELTDQDHNRHNGGNPT